MKKAGWFQRFTEASPEEQREMFAAQRRQDSERLLRKHSGHGQSVSSQGPSEADRDEAARWIERTRGPQPVDLDSFPRDSP